MWMWGVLLVAVIALAAGAFAKWRRRRPRPLGHGISLLVPFLSDHAERERNWLWLEEYWQHVLPGAEIIVAPNYDRPFCKSKAVNDAFRQSTGDVIVILDADAYLPAKSILECAAMIRADRRLWFIPYRRMYRLTAPATASITAGGPARPPTMWDPPPVDLWVDEGGRSFGHWFGALVQLMPREAFEAANGMDERFEGWGGEDISLMRAVDTLYARHRNLNAPAFHLYHPTTRAYADGSPRRDKQWADQPRKIMNTAITTRYNEAFLDRAKMQDLVDEAGFDV
jgi:hypothetical protein